MSQPIFTHRPAGEQPAMGVRRFGRVNWLGLRTLATREVMRFMAVWQQTIFAPLMTAALFVLIFALAMGQGRGQVMGLPYLVFLGPGILMMTVIQNAFANTSSSITSAKVQGNIVDTLMPPLSAGELLAGYLAGSVARAGLVGLVIGTGMVLVTGAGIAHPAWALTFVLLAALLLFGLGGYMLRRFGYPIAPVVVGLILGPMAEQQLRRALAISQGDPTVLIHSPLAIILLGLAVLALVVPMIMRARGRGAVLSQMASDED